MNAWSSMISFSQSGSVPCPSFPGLCWGHTLLFPWEDSLVTMHLPRMVKGIRAPHYDCPQWDAETEVLDKRKLICGRFCSQRIPSCPQDMHRTLPGVASGETFESFSSVRDPCLSSLLGLKRMESDNTGCWKPVCVEPQSSGPQPSASSVGPSEHRLLGSTLSVSESAGLGSTINDLHF